MAIAICFDVNFEELRLKYAAAQGDVAAIIKYFDVDRYVLVGHSMRGKIALELASQ